MREACGFGMKFGGKSLKINEFVNFSISTLTRPPLVEGVGCNSASSSLNWSADNRVAGAAIA